MSHPDPRALPQASDVNAQLQRMLDSAAFANAPILSRFLQFLVQHCLDGNRPVGGRNNAAAGLLQKDSDVVMNSMIHQVASATLGHAESMVPR